MSPTTWTVILERWPLCNCWIVKTPGGLVFKRFDPSDGTPSSYVQVPRGVVLKRHLRRQIDEAIEAWEENPD